MGNDIFDFELFKKRFCENLHNIKIVRPSYCEMSDSELQFLIYLLNEIKPHKVLEVGVAAGGATSLILDALSENSVLYSVDYAKQFYRNISKPTGYLAIDSYDDKRHPEWHRFFGYDLSECIGDIGNDIDFFFLDTVHTLPGEFLSFLVALPFLKENCVFVLHDICLHTMKLKRTPRETSSSYCNTLLFSSIHSENKLILPNEISNIGAIFLNKSQIMSHIEIILHILCIRWAYFPHKNILEKTRTFLVDFYPKRAVELYDIAVKYNREALLSDQEFEDRYEISRLLFDTISRGKAEPFTDTPAARYKKSGSGVFHEDKSGIANFMFCGDLMCQNYSRMALKQFDYFTQSFQYIKPIFKKADLVVGNLEACLSENAPYYNEKPSIVGSIPQLNTPVNWLDSLRWAGFDMLTTANNHILDAGLNGAMETLDHLERYGFIHTGTFRNRCEKRYSIIEISGIRISLHAYSMFYNGMDQKYVTQLGRKTILNKFTPQNGTQDFLNARKDGAEFIFVYIHYGRENIYEVSKEQQDLVQKLANAGADYVIGMHPHVLQEYDVVNTNDNRKVPVFYSIGNFISGLPEEYRRQTIILNIELRRNTAGKVILSDESYTPVFLEEGTLYPLIAPYNNKFKHPETEKHLNRIKELVGDKIKVRS